MLKVHLIAKNSFPLLGGPFPYQPLLRSLSVAGLRQQSPLRHPASGLLLRPAGHQSPKYSSIPVHGKIDSTAKLIGLVAEPARPAEAGAGCLSGPAGLGSKIYGITFLRITCNL